MSETRTLTFNGTWSIASWLTILAYSWQKIEVVRGIAEFSEFQAFLTYNSFSLTGRNSCVEVEVAIHTILYVRQVYPADLFVRRKKYETPVYQSRHPLLNEYISGAVQAIRDELELVSWSVEKLDAFFPESEYLYTCREM